MKLPFTRGNPGASPDPSPNNPDSQTMPSSSPNGQTGDESHAKRRLGEARVKLMLSMATTAERWAEILDNDDLNEEGWPLYPEALKERLFARAQAWIKEYNKLFPKDAAAEGGGVTAMRDWLNTPEGEKEMQRAVNRHLAKTAKKGSSGSFDRKAKQVQEAEGSGLHALVFEGEGLEETRD